MSETKTEAPIATGVWAGYLASEVVRVAQSRVTPPAQYKFEGRQLMYIEPPHQSAWLPSVCDVEELVEFGLRPAPVVQPAPPPECCIDEPGYLCEGCRAVYVVPPEPAPAPVERLSDEELARNIASWDATLEEPSPIRRALEELQERRRAGSDALFWMHQFTKADTAEHAADVRQAAAEAARDRALACNARVSEELSRTAGVIADLRAQVATLTQDLAEARASEVRESESSVAWRKNYVKVADSLLSESTSPEQVVAEAYRLRGLVRDLDRRLVERAADVERLTQERDDARREHEGAKGERDAHRIHSEMLLAERDAARKDAEAARAETHQSQVDWAEGWRSFKAGCGMYGHEPMWWKRAHRAAGYMAGRDQAELALAERDATIRDLAATATSYGRRVCLLLDVLRAAREAHRSLAVGPTAWRSLGRALSQYDRASKSGEVAK